MPGIVIVGLQWGDEGKGKVVDLLSGQASHVVRSQGCNTAGHTILSDERELIVHSIPSGILHPHIQCYITGGCRINTKQFITEIKRIESSGISLIDRLFVSPHATFVFPEFDVRACELGTSDIQTEYTEMLRAFVADAEGKLQAALSRDETVLLEGAHGTLLDQVFGTYPFVTPSSNLAGSVCAGAGISPIYIEEVVGVLKAYMTRVDEGPLPTQLDPDTYHEFDEVEKQRETMRLGWLDMVLARYATQINGVTQLVLSKFDVLDRLEEIKVCVGYELRGETITRPPPVAEDLAQVLPIYEVFPGWESSTREVRSVRGLPTNARNFIDAIEDFVNIPISMISVGPNREDIIEIDGEWM